jgi:hypothetical protein
VILPWLASQPARTEDPKEAALPKTVYEINEFADGLDIGPGSLFENGALYIDLGVLAALNVLTMAFSVSMGRVFGRT